ncbi:MAG: insulinase family protein [Planctomycetes bacterium]|nr:insulinase family protein [Planctomycetota bacterium]
MSERFYDKQLPNGLLLLGQKMEQVSSAAMTIIVPAGAAHDPAGLSGAASIVNEWAMRGAGERNTRQLNDALDSLGCQHHEAVRSDHVVFSTAQLSRNLDDVLGIYADILLSPRLEDATFEPSRALIAQDLESLEDEPAHKCSLMLRERFYPRPLGANVYGTVESLAAATPAALREHFGRRFSPEGTILAVAGDIDWPALCERAEQLLGDWAPTGAAGPAIEPPLAGIEHLTKDSAQAHIGLAYATVPLSDEQYYAARLAGMVLSGGAAARLHTELREKRGLVYHVSASYHSLKNCAGVFAYAASRPELAQQTFDMTVSEIRRLADGIEPDEITRARTQLKSALIMQGESTSARANALASDWYHLGRLRSLAELSDAIDATTATDVLQHVRDHPARDFTVLVIGPKPVDTGILEQ